MSNREEIGFKLMVWGGFGLLAVIALGTAVVVIRMLINAF